MKNTSSHNSLYQRLGGKEAISAVVDLFYKKVLGDSRVNHFFDDVSMDDQIKHQKLFMAYAFGGEPEYIGSSLRDAHKGLVEKHGLNEDHFDAVAENLEASMEELDVSKDLTKEVLLIVSKTKAEVLNH